MTSPLSYALHYAAHGWPVFPLDGKRPHPVLGAKGGFKLATTDEQTIERWWTAHPDANIGVPCGEISGFFVVDVDPRNGGDQAWTALLDQYGHPDATTAFALVQQTGGGGQHYLFEWDSAVRKGKLGEGIDVKRDGGYIVVEPSVTTKAYAFDDWDVFAEPPPLRPAPAWLLRLLSVPVETPATGKTTEKWDADVGKLRSALAMLSADDYPQWVTIGAALYHGSNGAALEEWIRWSRSSAKFEDGACEKRWPSFERAPSQRATLGSIYWMAMRAGWRPPRSRAPEPPTPDVPLDMRNPMPEGHRGDALQRAAEGLQAQTEVGIAEWFADSVSGRWRYDAISREWFELDETSGAWRRDRLDRITHEAREYVRRIPAAKPSTQRTSFVSGVLRLVSADPRIAFDGARWDLRPDVLGTPQGIFNLRTGERCRGTGNEDVSKSTACAPAAAGSEPVLFLRTLEDAFDGNQELIAFVQRAVGYCATGETREHRFIWAQGAGGAGSSTILDAITNPLGEYATAAPVEAFATVKGERHPTEIAALAGARLVSVAEFPRNRPADETRIKAWTSGDLHSARHIRGNPFTFRPTGKLWVTSNSPPTFLNVDAGIRRRLILLNFGVRVRDVDLDLPRKLAAERHEILRWIIDGAVMWYAQGLRPPRQLLENADTYFEEEDSVSVFFADRCEREPEFRAPAGELFKAWVAFCRDRNEFPGTAKAFGHLLRSKGFKPYRSGSQRGYQGLRLIDGGEGER